MLQGSHPLEISYSVKFKSGNFSRKNQLIVTFLLLQYDNNYHLH